MMGIPTRSSKNVSLVIAALAVALSQHHVQARLHGKEEVVASRQVERRRLDGASPTRWEDCISQGLTGAECEQLILDSVGGDLANHAIPSLEIKVSPQRGPATLAATQWMFGVRTNMFGEADCDLNGGASVYPWIWNAVDGNSYNIADVPCAGLNALDCCDSVLAYMDANNIPTTDIDGNCFSCWVHQQPLEPRLNDAGLVVYVDHSFNAELQKCEERIYSQADVQTEDTNVEATLIGVRADIGGLVSASNGGQAVTCGAVMNIRRGVLLYGRSFPVAMTAISGLLCGQCESGDAAEAITLSPDQIAALVKARSELAGVIKSDENCIIIYTNAGGDKVLKVPQVGGSLNDADPDTTGDGIDTLECPPGQEEDGAGGCMCPGITDMADHQAYWVEGQAINTANQGSCECPPNLIEFNDRCYCPGGFKLWDPVMLECVCPYGVDSSGQCICPGPFSGLDWNNVGWVPSPGFNGAAGCVVDFSCTQSEFDFYYNDNFAAGCYGCRYGSERNGICALDCNQNDGFGSGFVYDNDADECVCEESAHVVINGDCMCPAFGQILNSSGECECEIPGDFVSDEGVCINPNYQNDDGFFNPYGY